MIKMTEDHFCIPKTKKELESNIQNGVYTEFFDDDKIKIKCEYKNGQRHGKYLEYYDTGTIKYDIKYDKGLLHGPYKAYYDNEELNFKFMYSCGQKHGPASRFDREGFLISASNYKNNQLDGAFTVMNYTDSKTCYPSSGVYKDGVCQVSGNTDNYYKKPAVCCII